ncbi:hypothetical protein STCU_12179 [Strigomonas culicis]|uniref:Uncharacterized protein n=1 Tax=Strigomonas culicis TaxID=28005 RepID=S9TE80_9TRYP|nr:hypothetical protein STCU_12179 [Strigomonas culicis]|eukprot:EPY15269.1 hypothetical protein STCU_12179 [Strigomonas culicis]
MDGFEQRLLQLLDVMVNYQEAKAKEPQESKTDQPTANLLKEMAHATSALVQSLDDQTLRSVRPYWAEMKESLLSHKHYEQEANTEGQRKKLQDKFREKMKSRTPYTPETAFLVGQLLYPASTLKDPTLFLADLLMHCDYGRMIRQEAWYTLERSGESKVQRFGPVIPYLDVPLLPVECGELNDELLERGLQYVASLQAPSTELVGAGPHPENRLITRGRSRLDEFYDRSSRALSGGAVLHAVNATNEHVGTVDVTVVEEAYKVMADRVKEQDQAIELIQKKLEEFYRTQYEPLARTVNAMQQTSAQAPNGQLVVPGTQPAPKKSAANKQLEQLLSLLKIMDYMRPPAIREVPRLRRRQHRGHYYGGGTDTVEFTHEVVYEPLYRKN